MYAIAFMWDLWKKEIVIPLTTLAFFLLCQPFFVACATIVKCQSVIVDIDGTQERRYTESIVQVFWEK